MIIHDCEQGTPEWHAVRHGRPTCSALDQILTSKTLKRSGSAAKYRARLLTEWYVGHVIEWNESTAFMERGKEMEGQARAQYEWDKGLSVKQVGFLATDDGRFGGSPDALVGEDGGLELKCPLLHTHIGYWTDPATLVDEYRGQVQGYLYLTGRKWWDLMSFNPELPSVIERIYPDPAYQKALAETLEWFCGWLDDGKGKLVQYKEAA